VLEQNEHVETIVFERQLKANPDRGTVPLVSLTDILK
jgi:hypothetical protein